MKPRFFPVVLVLMIVFSMLIASCASPAAQSTQAPAAQQSATQAPAKSASGAEPVKIGVLLPLTGGDALEGSHIRDGHVMAVDEINAAGGIKCLNGAPLQIVLGDTQGMPEIGNSEAERLITKENVMVLTGALHSGVVLPTTEIAEKYKVPYVVASSIANKITGRGLKYVVQTRTDLNSFVKATVDFAKSNGAANAVSLTSNIEIGELGKLAYADLVPAGGLKLLDQISFAANNPDFSDAILKMKAADPDVVFIVANTRDAIQIVKQMKSLNYYPKMGMLNPGGGLADPSFITNLKDLSEYIGFSEEWSPKVKTGNSQEMNDKFKQRFGYNLAVGAATSYSSVHMIAAALEKTCSRDPQKLNEALHTMTFDKGPWNFEFPNGISFGENGLVKNAPVVMYQIQKGAQVPVFPDAAAQAKVVWPVPAWDKR